MQQGRGGGLLGAGQTDCRDWWRELKERGRPSCSLLWFYYTTYCSIHSTYCAGVWKLSCHPASPTTTPEERGFLLESPFFHSWLLYSIVGEKMCRGREAGNHMRAQKHCPKYSILQHTSTCECAGMVSHEIAWNFCKCKQSYYAFVLNLHHWMLNFSVLVLKVKSYAAC